MRRVARPALVALLAAGSIAGLAGCLPDPPAPTTTEAAPRTTLAPPIAPTYSVEAIPSSTPTPTATAAPQGECVNGYAEITQPGTYLMDDCQDVVIESSDVELLGGDFGTLLVRGETVLVTIDRVDQATVEGRINILISDEIGQLSVRGDGNDFRVEGLIGSLELLGNDNTVKAGQADSVNDGGQRNEVDAG